MVVTEQDPAVKETAVVEHHDDLVNLVDVVEVDVRVDHVAVVGVHQVDQFVQLVGIRELLDDDETDVDTGVQMV